MWMRGLLVYSGQNQCAFTGADGALGNQVDGVIGGGRVESSMSKGAC